MSPFPEQFHRVDTDGVNRPGLGDTIGFWALAFFLFSIFSSAIDFIGFSRTVRPSLVAAIVGLIALGVSGRAMVVFTHKVSLMFIALTVWDIACVPYAVWPGGSAHTIIGEWLVAVLTVFLAAGLISNPDQFRKIAHVIAYSSIILSAIALKVNALSIEDRLVLPGTRYANPNDLATILLLAAPFLAFMALRNGNGIRRPLAVCGAVPILLVIAKTGSRAAFIGAAVAMGALFLQLNFAQKIKLALGGAIVVGVLFAALPGQLTERLTTIFGASDLVYDAQKTAVLTSAIESSYSRRLLLLDSITLTLQHPVFGVGLGNFPVAQNNLALARGEKKGSWHVTHNTYTQVSSESGVPGLVLFLLAIFFSFRALSRVRRMSQAANSPAGQDIYVLATSIRISLLALLACGFFASMAYTAILTTLCGLTVSLELCSRGLAAATIPPSYAAREMPAFQANVKRPLRPIPQQLPRRA